MTGARRSTSGRAAAAALAAAALLLSACGTRVGGAAAGGAAVPGGQEAGFGLGTLTPPAGGAGGGPAAIPTVGAVPGEGPAPVAAAPVAPGAAPSPGAAAKPSPVPTGKGSVQIGIPYPANADEVNSAAGSDAGTGDPQRQWRVLVDDVNRRGGLGGRRLVPVFYEYDATGDFSTQAQAACSRFTEDNKVAAVLGSGLNFTPPTFFDCLQRAGVPVIESGGSTADASDMRRRSLALLVNGMTLDRMLTNTVEGLVEQRWMDRSSRIGVVTYDADAFRRAVQNGLLPALRKHGLSLARDVYVSFPDSQAGFGTIAAQTANAVLRFRSEGIDRVLFAQVGGEIALFFMQAAESQGYRPQYGLNSTDGGSVLAGAVPEEQLRGSKGIGWYPTTDVGPTNDPLSSRAARRACLDVFRKAGVQFGDTNALFIGLNQCDMVGMLEAAVARSGVATGQGIAAGAARLGSSFESATTFGTAFGPGLRDGASHWRPLSFVPDCRCFRYTGGLRNAV